MLCPVCKQRPLKGRQSTCSTKCRSALYRERKQKQRDTSRRAAGHATAAATTRSTTSQRHSPDERRLEQFISAATDRIVKAVQRQASLFAQPPREAWRVDLREQVTSLAPKMAVGYRLVLPGRSVGDAPKFSPRRTRTRDIAWYGLNPFEYPDDIRLSDGFWYRIVWIDGQGQRLQIPATEPSPALYFFLGPPHAPAHPATERSQVPKPSEEAQQRPVAAVPIPTTRTESEQEEAASAPVTGSSPAVASDTAPDQVDSIGASAGTAPPTAPLPPLSVSLDDGISPETQAAFFKLLASFPPIPTERWAPVYAFVMQVPWMIWLASDDRRRDALANGQPPPPMPILNLSAKETALIEKLLRTEPPHFIPFCKQLFAFLHQHGTHVLVLASCPFHPLADEQQKQILQALREPNSKAYLEYIYRFHDAQLHQRKLPEEPAVKLSSNQRRELKKLMFDLRAVLFFKHHALPGE